MCHFFQNAVTPEIIVGIAHLVHRGTLGAPSIFYFDLGVTSRHLSITFIVLKKLAKVDISTKTLGVGIVQFGEIVSKGLYSVFLLHC